jgi:hypothetical protein
MSTDSGSDRSQISTEGDRSGSELITEESRATEGSSRYRCRDACCRAKGFLKRLKADHWLVLGTWMLVVVTWVLVTDGRDTADRQIAELKESNRINNAALTSVQRAFVSIGTPLFLESPDPHIPGSTLYELTFRWINSGNTPTSNLSMKFRFISSDTRLDSPFEFTANDVIPHEFIAPHDAAMIGSYFMSHEQTAAVARRHTYFYAIAQANYDDALGSRLHHQTQFCAAYLGDAGMLAPNIRQTHWESCPRHNCADAECTD